MFYINVSEFSIDLCLIWVNLVIFHDVCPDLIKCDVFSFLIFLIKHSKYSYLIFLFLDI